MTLPPSTTWIVMSDCSYTGSVFILSFIHTSNCSLNHMPTHPPIRQPTQQSTHTHQSASLPDNPLTLSSFFQPSKHLVIHLPVHPSSHRAIHTNPAPHPPIHSLSRSPEDRSTATFIYLSLSSKRMFFSQPITRAVCPFTHVLHAVTRASLVSTLTQNIFFSHGFNTFTCLFFISQFTNLHDQDCDVALIVPSTELIKMKMKTRDRETRCSSITGVSFCRVMLFFYISCILLR